jgi:hypothetical protein
VGIARRSIEVMSAYTQERQAFGKPIGDFGQIQSMIAESYAEYMAGRSYVYQIAKDLDLSSTGNGLDADGVKLFCAPMAKRVADRAIQCLGGYGYVGEYQVRQRPPWSLTRRLVYVSHACHSYSCILLSMMALTDYSSPTYAYELLTFPSLPLSLFTSLRPSTPAATARHCPGGASLARREAPRDWRRHQRGAPQEHGAGP